MPLTNYALDNFIAPNLSELDRNNIPDLSEHVSSWLTSFLLNSMFRFQIDDPHRQYIINFLRRVDGVFYEYQNGSKALNKYLENPNKSVSRYYRAVSHFEQVVAQTYQAFMLGRRLIEQEKIFKKGEGSSLERLNELYNITKHFDDRIKKGQIEEGIILPVWITNTGLESQNKKVSFEELAAMLKELSSVAESLSSPPNTEEQKNKNQEK